MADWSAYLRSRADSKLKKSVDVAMGIIKMKGPMTSDSLWKEMGMSRTHIHLVVRFGVLTGKFLPIAHIHGKFGHRKHVYALNTPKIHDAAWKIDQLKGALCTCISQTDRHRYPRTAPK